MQKTARAISKTKADYVIANILQERYNKVYVVNEHTKHVIIKEGEEAIEVPLIKLVIELHRNYIQL